MSIKKILKKEGIEVNSELDTLTVNKVAKNVATALCSTFPTLNLNQNELFIRISRLKMYFAKLPNGISAKYFYKNNSIYFDLNLSKESLTNVAIHECIHYLQEKRDKRNDVIRLGLCDYTKSSFNGIGLNEAAVQFMAAKAQKSPYESVKYFDIELQTNTPTYYPLECALIAQMAYVIGEDVLFDSTLRANDNFRNEYISMTSEKVFNIIQKNIDLLVQAQGELENLYASLDEIGIDETFVHKVSKEIEITKVKIKKIFLNTQKIILTSYFDNSINLAYTPKALERYRNKLYLFKNLIGYMQGDTTYNDYYVDKMMELEKRYEINMSELTDLAVIKTSFLSRIIAKVKLVFKINKGYERV